MRDAGGFDDRLEVLVGAGDLVDHAGVLAALHSRGLSGQVVEGEGPLGLRPRHPAAGAVGRGAVRRLVAEAAYDVRAGAHRTRDQAVLARAGPDRALAGHDQVDAVVGLLRHVIVVRGDLLAELTSRPRSANARATTSQNSAIMTARLRAAYSCAQ